MSNLPQNPSASPVIPWIYIGAGDRVEHCYNPASRAHWDARPVHPSGQAAMHHDYLEKILNVQVYDAAIESPLDLARNLSARTGNPAYKLFLG